MKTNLKGSEQFVVEAIKSYFEEIYKDVSVEEGENPPDVYLCLDGRKIPVEITNIDKNVLDDSKTISRGYMKFNEKLNGYFNEKINDEIRLLITINHYGNKVSAFKKEFMRYLQKLIEINSFTIGNEIKSNICGVDFRITVEKKSCNKPNKISLMVGSGHKNSGNMILPDQAFSIVSHSINIKNEKCIHIKNQYG
ncbi:MAG: hypothetical protein JXQ68_01055 [Campylobacterales bacterium]|nr:hypothetical protein [Campylobacterales bacterium]